MLPAAKDITVYRGADYTIVFAVKNADNSAKNLSGYVAKMQVRTTAETATPLLSYETPTDDELNIDGAAGTITLTVPGADTEALTVRTDELDAVYDMRLTGTGGDVFFPFAGAFVITNSITK